MNMKNTVILLIFLLSVLGLIIGVHYTEDVNSDDSLNNDFDSINEDTDNDITVTLEKKENIDLSEFLT